MAGSIDVPPVMVIDASVMLCFLLPDERNEEIQSIIRQHVDGTLALIAPPIFPYEVINGLALAARRGRINAETFHSLAGQFITLAIGIRDPVLSDVGALAVTLGITAYDASYVALARELKIPLLTLDDRLKKLP